jgi:hypothetical protein
VVGAPTRNHHTGAVYVFTGSGASWRQRTRLTAPDGHRGDYFGDSLAISGNTIVVGALFHNHHAGAVYVFTGSGASWTQAELTAPDGGRGTDFGNSVAISRNTIMAGASGTNGAIGAAYVFTRAGSSWTLQAELTAGDGAPADYFGTVVAIAGNTAAISAPPVNDDAGVVYVFTRADGTWTQQTELTASDASPNADFGDSLAIDASAIVVGALHFTSPGSGTAYVFTGSGASWAQQAELTASDGAPGNYFGVSVAISRTTAIVGADGAHATTGAAYVFINL